MKKACLCLAALALLCALSFAAAAAEEEIPLCLPGDSIEVTFTLLENPGKAVAATMQLEYDHRVMELIPDNVAQNDGTFLLDMNGIAEGTTVTVGFQTLPDIPADVYEIRLIVTQAGDIDENFITDMVFSTERFMVADLSAPAPEPQETPAPEPEATDSPAMQLTGDVTGDGKVDIFDAIRLRKHLSGEDVEVVPEMCDVNGNGTVDIFDLIRLQKMLSQE